MRHQRLAATVIGCAALVAAGMAPSHADPAATFIIYDGLGIFVDDTNDMAAFVNTTREAYCTDEVVAAENAFLAWQQGGKLATHPSSPSLSARFRWKPRRRMWALATSDLRSRSQSRSSCGPSRGASPRRRAILSPRASTPTASLTPQPFPWPAGSYLPRDGGRGRSRTTTSSELGLARTCGGIASPQPCPAQATTTATPRSSPTTSCAASTRGPRPSRCVPDHPLPAARRVPRVRCGRLARREWRIWPARGDRPIEAACMSQHAQ